MRYKAYSWDKRPVFEPVSWWRASLTMGRPQITHILVTQKVNNAYRGTLPDGSAVSFIPDRATGEVFFTNDFKEASRWLVSMAQGRVEAAVDSLKQARLLVKEMKR
jgi:hypothetical protein